MGTNVVWVLLLAVCALAGWWLALRPGASYRGASGAVSYLIFAMAALMCLLAVDSQRGVPRRAMAAIHQRQKQAPVVTTASDPIASECDGGRRR